MQAAKQELIVLKKKILDHRFQRMNSMQKLAVFQTEGPVLILAGAGSGKTTVLVNRIAYMMHFGNAYLNDAIPQDLTETGYAFLKEIEDKNDYDVEQLKEALNINPINPWNILAITFTNKAANELKERLEAMLGEAATHINAGTFHSICVRILRKEIEALGYEKSFTIYDTDDSLRVIKDCMSELSLDDKMYPPKALLGSISRAKDSMISPDDYLKENGDDFRKKAIGNVYASYQKKLKNSNALDFDDIIGLTVQLFMENEDVLHHYQNLYKYILVDEYQDTNHAQYQLVSLLSARHQNLCVVGDDDQSIYKFRGATIENILSFEQEFKGATVIRLEQNYRSTQNILDAANEVIKNNAARKGKNLWTENGSGDKITQYRAQDEVGEALFIAKEIEKNIQDGMRFGDHAILYRTNAQSATIERQFVKAGIPYKIVGGHKFFDRKEIKDVLAYFHIIDNAYDSVRLKRVINEPKRGIGDTTVKNIEAIAQQLGVSMLEVMKNSADYGSLAKKSMSLIRFATMIEELYELSLTLSLDELLDELLEKTTYLEYLKAQGKDGEPRIENIEELKSNLVKYEEENEEATLSGFLEEVSLYTDLDTVNSSDDSVIMMTMHSAKGLEYKSVFVIGLEEGLFPSYMSSNSAEELEEERRLAYVALTRAKQKLYLTNSAQRMLFGRTSRNLPSRFLKEIPTDLIELVDDTQKAFGYAPRPEKPKPVYKPELEGMVGVQKQVEKATISYTIGDFVEHKMFGKGKVVSMTKMSNDTLVEVVFDKVGTKKIMANFAKLNKISI
ncbi:3'-5' exonuclease [Paludicola sp. MB14-C6]|uniref:ATP-dependent helicase n=1 Tax=Paludihabitans sp. MB14-C6 TaxID=3070656 RepID=UPI0027DB83FD|nr:UvrD-helicase domain-containing protein [Paludicola sp. MB14-C6]WMJ23490.1 3'-5' exonuclease [Paludicola sp. MB14-C6]